LSPGDRVTWRILVTNTGQVDVDGATIVDVLPANVFDVAWECVAVAGAPRCITPFGVGDVSALVNIAVGEEVHVLVSGTLDGTSAKLVNTASVSLPDGLLDVSVGGNSDTAESSIGLLPQTIEQSPTAVPPTAIPPTAMPTVTQIAPTATPLSTSTPTPTAIGQPLDIVDVPDKPPTPLAFSGRTVVSTLGVGVALIAAGWVLLLARRRRHQE